MQSAPPRVSCRGTSRFRSEDKLLPSDVDDDLQRFKMA